jgi:hypothetical protein
MIVPPFTSIPNVKNWHLKPQQILCILQIVTKRHNERILNLAERLAMMA